MYYVNQFRCANGSFYNVCTNNLEARLERHAKGYDLSTKDKLPIEIEIITGFTQSNSNNIDFDFLISL